MLLRYRISPRDPHFASIFSPGSESDLVEGKEKRTETPWRAWLRAGVCSEFRMRPSGGESVAPAALFLDSKYFPPPIPDELRGPSLPVPCLVGDLGLQGGRCILPASAQPECPQTAAGAPLVAAAGWGEARAPWRSALEPRAAAFCFSGGRADHEARALSVAG